MAEGQNLEVTDLSCLRNEKHECLYAKYGTSLHTKTAEVLSIALNDTYQLYESYTAYHKAVFRQIYKVEGNTYHIRSPRGRKTH